ncbi:ornithine decarboxylase [Sclerotinia borealis F-4128]|uniref:ornithine decarboxylase n=1 Tax=Sclerotinia borealis (strain F-4128) TaxID=1432307 RepID=W9C6D5_SCLBF|nr:ornithine decarboxylase [Sclerotinia borealis F-4128]
METLSLSVDRQTVDDLIHTQLQFFQESPYGRDNDIPFFVADAAEVIQRHQRWKMALPHIHPFYAVKCNPDEKLLEMLANMGVNFDCASLLEIEQVLKMGVDPGRIIFAHPCKSPSALDTAARRGVRWTTFDNADELDKIQKISPKMELLLRIYVRDFGSKTPLGTKFGASMKVTRALLEKAHLLKLKIVGVSFHIGSGSSDPNAFVTAVHDARRVFENGKVLGFNMYMLDVGGGFEDESFEAMACSLREEITREFPGPMTFIAEPGRFYANGFYTMVCQVIARRVQTNTEDYKLPDMLYLNDGIYGCFSLLWSENATFVPTLISPQGKSKVIPRKLAPHRYSIWGPTCDGIDCISKEVVMDQEIMIGDWLKFQNMGAYSISASSKFNGFSNDYKVIYAE